MARVSYIPRGSGFLLRFIDIGLIILFGFLMITDIQIFSQIKMPGRAEDATVPDAQRLSFVTVEILPGGRFTVVEREREEVFCHNVTALDRLEACLVAVRDALRQRDRQPVVLINPARGSIVQHTVDVLDICDRNGILKNINREAIKL
ncbi:biopolymer transporter ExbD [Rhodocaloribacter litoris]|uniref:ExbD/TolR family protein n=1 Tax=Rhodocaloribacter litoris TaxID=2558931 RepID=UPI00141F018A|nr:biopolymer transporter ExbD [Rhodocaloribacter litoris]QXD15902.1 biopolymer transporter ExbD [Rhodocaloribacter litoris]